MNVFPQKLNVLCAEDEPDFAFMAKRRLDMSHLVREVRLVRDGLEMIDVLAANPTHFDVVISDIHMEQGASDIEKNGIVCLRRVYKEIEGVRGRLKAFLLSGGFKYSSKWFAEALADLFENEPDVLGVGGKEGVNVREIAEAVYDSLYSVNGEASAAQEMFGGHTRGFFKKNAADLLVPRRFAECGEEAVEACQDCGCGVQ
jgi:CheY-like chemotaxis protein